MDVRMFRHVKPDLNMRKSLKTEKEQSPGEHLSDIKMTRVVAIYG